MNSKNTQNLSSDTHKYTNPSQYPRNEEHDRQAFTEKEHSISSDKNKAPVNDYARYEYRINNMVKLFFIHREKLQEKINKLGNIHKLSFKFIDQLTKKIVEMKNIVNDETNDVSQSSHESLDEEIDIVKYSSVEDNPVLTFARNSTAPQDFMRSPVQNQTGKTVPSLIKKLNLAEVSENNNFYDVNKSNEHPFEQKKRITAGFNRNQLGDSDGKSSPETFNLDIMNYNRKNSFEDELMEETNMVLKILSEENETLMLLENYISRNYDGNPEDIDVVDFLQEVDKHFDKEKLNIHSSLEDKLKDMKETIDILESTLLDLKHDNTGVESSVTKMISTVKRLNAEMAKARALEQENVDLRLENQEQKKKVSAITANEPSIQDKSWNGDKQEFYLLKQQNEYLIGKNDDQEKRLGAYELRNSNAFKLNSSSDKLSNNEFNSLQKENDEMKTRFQRSHTDLCNANDKLLSLQTDLYDVKKENLNMQSQLAQERSQKAELEIKLQEMRRNTIISSETNNMQDTFVTNVVSDADLLDMHKNFDELTKKYNEKKQNYKNQIAEKDEMITNLESEKKILLYQETEFRKEIAEQNKLNQEMQKENQNLSATLESLHRTSSMDGQINLTHKPTLHQYDEYTNEFKKVNSIDYTAQNLKEKPKGHGNQLDIVRDSYDDKKMQYQYSKINDNYRQDEYELLKQKQDFELPELQGEIEELKETNELLMFELRKEKQNNKCSITGRKSSTTPQKGLTKRSKTPNNGSPNQSFDSGRAKSHRNTKGSIRKESIPFPNRLNTKHNNSISLLDNENDYLQQIHIQATTLEGQQKEIEQTSEMCEQIVLKYTNLQNDNKDLINDNRDLKEERSEIISEKDLLKNKVYNLQQELTGINTSNMLEVRDFPDNISMGYDDGSDQIISENHSAEEITGGDLNSKS